MHSVSQGGVDISEVEPTGDNWHHEYRNGEQRGQPEQRLTHRLHSYTTTMSMVSIVI